MKRSILLSLFFFFNLCSFLSWGQIVLNNGAIIYINGGTTAANKVFVVLNSPPATPIVMSNSVAAQGIRMETEFSKLKYNLGTGTTAITVPYLSWNKECFPLTVSSVTAGVGATGAINFSSVPAGTTLAARNAGWDNNGYRPTQVSNMYDLSSTNNSAHTIDRFWIIEPVYYTTRPGVNLDFTYITAEAAANGSGNIANLNTTLMAQRFDTTAAQTWNGFGPAGTNTPGATFGTVTGVTVASTDFTPDWTLNDYNVTLPIELLDIKGSCEEGHSNIKWITASERNSHHFTVEKSTDGVYFSEVAKINAAGNSTSHKNYSFKDNSTGDGSTTYYRVSETDRNGVTEILKTVVIEKCLGDIKNEEGSVYSPDNQSVMISFLSGSAQNVSITAFDISGRLILQDQEAAQEGNNTFRIPTNLASGVYLFEIRTNSKTIVKKIIIDNKN